MRKIKFMNHQIKLENDSQSKIIFGISAFTLLYVLLFKNIDIYKYAVVGAAFELLWLVMVAAIFIMPIIAMWFLLKRKFTFKSLYFYSLLISAVSILLLLM